MRTSWFGRVFGLSGGHDAWDSLAGSASAGAPAPPTAIVDSDELAAELARARRYEHDLAVVVLSARPGLHATAAHPPAPESKLPQMVAFMTAVALREALRHSDIVCYQASENRFVLALAESSADDAQHAITRIAEDFRSRHSLQVHAGVAAFPRDALTLDELVAAAAGRAARPAGAAAGTNGDGRQRSGRRTDVARGAVHAQTREHA